nr:cyanoexosortase A system-associated protein [Scytonema sp. UIC 10036]
MLGLTFICILVVLGNIILLSKVDQHDVAYFVFPEEIPLPTWQFSQSYFLPNLNKEYPELLAQKHYQYIQNNLSLDIEMYYLKDRNTPISLENLTFTSSPPTVRKKEGIGYYGLGVEQQRAYLSACIHAQGSSTFTEEQFEQNQYLYQMQPQRLLPWLLNQEPLQDRRCLWTRLSIPLKNGSSKEAYYILEKAWFSWYQWWQPRFPKHRSMS